MPLPPPVTRATFPSNLRAFCDVPLVERSSAASTLEGEVKLAVERVHGHTLKDVSLVVRAGEIVAVYGVLGSGFEELGSNIVDGHVLPGGRIVVNGTDVSKKGLPVAIQSGLGYVPPERRTQGLNLSGSVANNITIGMLSTHSRFGMIRKNHMALTVAQWIAELRIKTPSGETPVGSLSGGSQQKVLMARWLAAGSSVFVLEEPTRGVDIATKRELYEVFRKEARNGAAILIISSDLEEISEIANRVLVVRSGDIVAELNGALRGEIAESALLPT